MLIIVDFGVGNLGSLLNMTKYLNIEAKISRRKKDLLNASKIILPGVGSFDYAMQSIKKLELFEVLNNCALNKKTPILGICLGMQLMAKNSEEGFEGGFGWIDAVVKKIPVKNNFKVPLVGWSRLNLIRQSKLLNEIDKYSRFYFTHSYYVSCTNQNEVVANVNYSTQVTASFEKNNIFGVQFHPEKSHHFGMQIINNFCKKIIII